MRSSVWAQGLALGVCLLIGTIELALGWHGVWTLELTFKHTHIHTHSVNGSAVLYSQLGVTPGHYEEVITTLVYILKFKIKTTFTSCSNNNLQTCFNLHTHTNKPWSTPNSIFIRFSPQVYRNTIICLKMQNGCRSDVSMQDTLQILHHNTNPNHTLGTSNTFSQCTTNTKTWTIQSILFTLSYLWISMAKGFMFYCTFCKLVMCNFCSIWYWNFSLESMKCIYLTSNRLMVTAIRYARSNNANDLTMSSWLPSGTRPFFCSEINK